MPPRLSQTPTCNFVPPISTPRSMRCVRFYPPPALIGSALIPYAVNVPSLRLSRPPSTPANTPHRKKVAHQPLIVGIFQLNPKGACIMAGYVLLFQYTDQGIRNVVDTIKRAAAAREMARSEERRVGKECRSRW